MSATNKTIGAIIATAVIGSLTFFMSSPKKVSKNKVKTTKTSTQARNEEKEDLFI